LTHSNALGFRHTGLEAQKINTWLVILWFVRHVKTREHQEDKPKKETL
jgi:hypothetical protein